jgi:hypothetical protein
MRRGCRAEERQADRLLLVLPGSSETGAVLEGVTAYEVAVQMVALGWKCP